MKPWTKSISGWKLECETTSASRLDAFGQFYNVRFDSANITQNKYFLLTGVFMIFFSVTLLLASVFCGIMNITAQIVIIGVQRAVVFIMSTILLVRIYKSKE
jgi:hypothetical protein